MRAKTGWGDVPARAARTSVVICAYTLERWGLLQEALASVHAQTEAPGQVVLVVDGDPELAGRARRGFEGVDVLENRHAPGLAGARNSGVEAARGEIVAFLDDDAVADPGWLAALVAPYADGDVVGSGGTVLPAWDGDGGRPWWFPEEFDWVIGCTYPGWDRGRRGIRNPIGANMSFRRSDVERVGGFSPELGRIGADAAGCEETDLAIRLTSSRPGAVIAAAPGAVVAHHVPAHRLTLAYFVRRCVSEGRSKAILRRRARGLALASEKSYVTRLVGRTAAYATEAVRTRRAAPLVRAAALWLGVGAAAAGFAAARPRRAAAPDGAAA